jgi:hypothetical protein
LAEMSNELFTLLANTDVLRIYITLDERSFVLLDALCTELQNNRRHAKLHICVKASLSAAL